MHEYQKRSSSPNLAALQAYQRKRTAEQASSSRGGQEEEPLPKINRDLIYKAYQMRRSQLFPSQEVQQEKQSDSASSKAQADVAQTTDEEQDVQGKGNWQQKADTKAIFSNGSALSSGLMAKYENLMPGVSLGHVSLHQGSQVDAALGAAGLHGLTDGTNVAVASTAPSGTLEHEIGHVAQRQEQGFSLDEGNRQAYEADADHIAAKLSNDRPVERFGQTVNSPGLAARLQLKAIAVTQAKCSQCEENQPELVQQLMAKSLVAQGGHQAQNQHQTAFRPDTSPISLPHLNQTKDRQIHQEKEALQAAPMLNPNGQECQELLRKIRNIIQDIKKREGELHDNSNNLPETTPNDHINPRESKRGHRRLINQLKKTLAQRKGEYVAKCGQLPDDVRESEDPNVNWFQWPNIQLPNPGEWIPPIPIPANPFRFAN